MKRREIIKSLALGGAVGLALSNRADARDASVEKRKRSVRFVHLTDVHVQSKRSAPDGLLKAIEHVHSLPDPPEFIINGGDAIGDALEVNREEAERQWKLWNDAWSTWGAIPVWNCLGNHDIWGWNRAKSKTRGDEDRWGKQMALDQFGMAQGYYSFEHGGWRFLILDSMMFDEETAYKAELDVEQFRWLQTELAKTPQTTSVVVISHIPILTVGTVGFSQELRQYPQATRMLSHVDASELLALFRKYPNVKLCLSGHTHLTEKVEFGGIGFVNSGAISGLWWKGNFHHTDEGYNIIDLYDDGTYWTQYTSYGWQAAGPGSR